MDSDLFESYPRNIYRPFLSVVENRKGVLDCDTVKGCSHGTSTYPDGGCYGECYAYKNAKRYGMNFTVSVVRRIKDAKKLFLYIKNHHSTWYRIGVSGDPSLNWEHTVSVCEVFRKTGKTPVIITKHWNILSDDHLLRLKKLKAIINTSTSGLDSEIEITHRIGQFNRVSAFGLRSICRIVTCRYGNTTFGKECNDKQMFLLSLGNKIDNPLRAGKNNKHVLSGDIVLTRRKDSIGGGKFVSLHRNDVYLGKCEYCPDQCGADKPQGDTWNRQLSCQSQQLPLNM